jgi:hypothetical protein
MAVGILHGWLGALAGNWLAESAVLSLEPGSEPEEWVVFRFEVSEGRHMHTQAAVTSERCGRRRVCRSQPGVVEPVAIARQPVLEALHLVSGAGQSFSTWNHSSSSETVA